MIIFDIFMLLVAVVGVLSELKLEISFCVLVVFFVVIGSFYSSIGAIIQLVLLCRSSSTFVWSV